jgi:hypothetical protein
MPEIVPRDWQTLVNRTRQKRLLPIISDRVTSRLLFDKRQLIQAWADDIGYPMGHSLNITRLAQYWGIEGSDDLAAKEDYLSFLKRYYLKERAGAAGAQQKSANLKGDLRSIRLAELAGRLDQAILDDATRNPLRYLAQLPVEIYITTSYHNFLEQALLATGKAPRVEICFWDHHLRRRPPAETGANPLLELRDALAESYSLEELHDLAFALNLEFDDLPGQVLKAKARALVELLKRQDRLAELAPLCRKNRPAVNWDELLGLDTARNDAEDTMTLTSVFDIEPNYVPSVDQPLVYHLLGLDLVPASMVFTEDDFLNFLVNVSGDRRVVNQLVQTAITHSSLLLLGYELQDWDFRVLFRGLIAQKRESRRWLSVAIQLTPSADGDDQPAEIRGAQSYLERYFDKAEFKIYWGSSLGFVQQLWQNWEETA